MVQQLEMQATAVLIMCWKDAEWKRGEAKVYASQEHQVIVLKHIIERTYSD